MAEGAGARTGGAAELGERETEGSSSERVPLTVSAQNNRAQQWADRSTHTTSSTANQCTIVTHRLRLRPPGRCPGRVHDGVGEVAASATTPVCPRSSLTQPCPPPSSASSLSQRGTTSSPRSCGWEMRVVSCSCVQVCVWGARRCGCGGSLGVSHPPCRDELAAASACSTIAIASAPPLEHRPCQQRTDMEDQRTWSQSGWMRVEQWGRAAAAVACVRSGSPVAMAVLQSRFGLSSCVFFLTSSTLYPGTPAAQCLAWTGTVGSGA